MKSLKDYFFEDEDKFVSVEYNTTTSDDVTLAGTINDPENKVIDVEYGFRVKSVATSTPAHKKITPTKTVASGSGVGQYAKNIFRKLLDNCKLTSAMVSNLMNKDYCSKEFGISYPVLVLDVSGAYDRRRYYKNVVAGKYLICSQWYAKNRIRIDDWLAKNNL